MRNPKMLRPMAKEFLKRKGIRRKEAYLRMLDRQYGRIDAFFYTLFDNPKPWVF